MMTIALQLSCFAFSRSQSNNLTTRGLSICTGFFLMGCSDWIVEEISKAVSRSVLLSSIWLPQKVGPSSAVVNFFSTWSF